MNVSNISKYIFSVFLDSMKYFYSIMSLIIMLFIYLSLRLAGSDSSTVSFGGLGVSSLIFLFILGLSFFKSEFNFLLSTNITRKNFFKGVLLSSVFAALLMASVGAVFNQVFTMLMPGFHFDWVEGIYKTNSMTANLIWSFSVYILALIGGWLISTIYYRLSKTMKIVVSILPVAMLVLMSAADTSTSGAVIDTIGNGLRFLFGLNTLNPYAAAVNLMIVAAGLSGLVYLLIRRLELKA